MAKSSSTNTSFSPSMDFGAPPPNVVANDAGLGPFGTVNWSGSGPSSTTPAKDNAAEVEVNRPTTPTVDVSGINANVNNEAVTSEVALANNPTINATINATEDFSWVTDSKWNPETETTHWDSKAEQAREVAGYNQRKARNWTYAGDWRATDKPVYTMSGNTLIPNYENKRKYDKFIAPLAKNNIASKNNIESISNALKAIGKDAGKINQELAKVNPEVIENFDIGKKIGKKNTADYEKDYTDAVNKYGKDSKQALKAQAKLSAYLSSLTAIGEAALTNGEDYLSMVGPHEPGKRVSKKIGNYTYTVENIGKNVEGDTEFAVVIDDNKTGTSFTFKAKGDETISKDSLAEARNEIVNMVDKSMIATGLKEAPAPVETTPETPETTPEPEPATIAPEETVPLAPETPEVDDETVGVDTFKEEVEGKEFAKIATEEFTAMNEIAEEINSIDVSNFENIEQAKEAQTKLNAAFTKLNVEAENQLNQYVADLTAEGKNLKAIRNSPGFKSRLTEVFASAQAIYDKTCAIEDYTNRYLGDIDISSKRSIKKNADKISMRIDQMTNKISPYMTKEDINALAKYSKSVDSTKDAAIALMKVTAFNGAKNVKGDFYSEAWKSDNAEHWSSNGWAETKNSIRDFFAAFTPIKDSGKLTTGDFLALGLKGSLGFAVTIVGFATIAANPVLGSLLAFAGVKSVTENMGKIVALENRSNLTNEETMFDENLPGYAKFWNSVYNRSFEKANIGDPKSVATYTTVLGLLADFAKLATGIGALLPDAISSIRDKIDNLAHGGLEGRTDALISNVYNLAKNIVEWADANPGAIESLAKEGNRNEIGNTNPSSTSYNFITDEDIIENNKKPAKVVEDKGRETGFGVEGGSAEAAASTFSGAREQAKNSNLATDYNAGMEQEVNEAVSDKYVKVFKVMIDKEPDYIRKVLIAIPKNHCEREW